MDMSKFVKISRGTFAAFMGVVLCCLPGAARAAFFTVNTPNPAVAEDGLCSLREAAANAAANELVYEDCVRPGNHDLVDVIEFGAMVNELTMDLAGEPVVVTESLEIRGPGKDVLVIRNARGRIFEVQGPKTGATLSLSNLTLKDGLSRSHGGAILVQGAADAVKLSNVLVENCVTSGDGGALCLLNGSLEAVDLTVTECTAENGGAVALKGDRAKALIRRSTMYKNTAMDSGGAVYVEAGQAELENSTIHVNGAASGGGVAVLEKGGVHLEHVTLTQNTATTQGGGLFASGNATSGATSSGKAVESTIPESNAAAARSIIGNNAAPVGPDIAGPLESGDYNLINDPSGAHITGAAEHNHYNEPPLLKPLNPNGGNTRTQLPAPNSPALDKAKTSPLKEDQMGTKRPQDKLYDLGAVEVRADTMQKQRLPSMSEWIMIAGLLFFLGILRAMRKQTGRARKR